MNPETEFMRMNPKQRFVGTVAAAVFALAMFFPPWVYTHNGHITGSAGFSCILWSPDSVGEVRMDTSRLFVECLFILSFGGAAWLWMGRGTADPPLRHGVPRASTPPQPKPFLPTSVNQWLLIAGLGVLAAVSAAITVPTFNESAEPTPSLKPKKGLYDDIPQVKPKKSFSWEEAQTAVPKWEDTEPIEPAALSRPKFTPPPLSSKRPTPPPGFVLDAPTVPPPPNGFVLDEEKPPQTLTADEFQGTSKKTLSASEFSGQPDVEPSAPAKPAKPRFGADDPIVEPKPRFGSADTLVESPPAFIEVRVKGFGTVKFPDIMTQDEIRAVLRREFPPSGIAPDKKGAFDNLIPNPFGDLIPTNKPTKGLYDYIPSATIPPSHNPKTP